jgi:hypothetical protein
MGAFETVFNAAVCICGLLLMVFSRRLADHRAEISFSTTDLESTDPHMQRKIGRFRISIIVGCLVMGTIAEGGFVLSVLR